MLLVDVDYVSGRWCYVDGRDVSCHSGDFLSYYFMFFDLIFLDFHIFIANV